MSLRCAKGSGPPRKALQSQIARFPRNLPTARLIQLACGS